MTKEKSRVCVRCGVSFPVKTSAKPYCRDCRGLVILIKKETKQISDRARFFVFQRDDFRCVYCGRSSIEDGVKLCLDHVLPFDKSFDNTIYNLVTCCIECNMCKSDNVLKRDVYERIINRTIEKNNGITPEKRAELNDILDTHFKDSYGYDENYVK